MYSPSNCHSEQGISTLLAALIVKRLICCSVVSRFSYCLNCFRSCLQLLFGGIYRVSMLPLSRDERRRCSVAIIQVYDQRSPLCPDVMLVGGLRFTFMPIGWHTARLTAAHRLRLRQLRCPRNNQIESRRYPELAMRIPVAFHVQRLYRALRPWVSRKRWKRFVCSSACVHVPMYPRARATIIRLRAFLRTRLLLSHSTLPGLLRVDRCWALISAVIRSNR